MTDPGVIRLQTQIGALQRTVQRISTLTPRGAPARQAKDSHQDEEAEQQATGTRRPPRRARKS
jgi:hypothetical protein